jgi:hypothetical protein
VLAYRRRLGGREILVALNLGDRHQELALARAGEVRLSTRLDRRGEPADRTVRLRPHEGAIVELR